MGLSAVAHVSEELQICIFDLRRGQYEGQELDKILFFFPVDSPFSVQLSVIGLSEGLITFTRIFSPGASCEVIEADKHSHVFYEAEPDIWMVMIAVEDKEVEAVWRTEALRTILKEVHSLFTMFHGSIRSVLEAEPDGRLVRSSLFSFIMDYLKAFYNPSPLDICCCDFLVGKKLHMPSFRDSLQERGTVQMLTVGREAAIEVQSLVKTIEASAGVPTCYSLILFQDLLVSSTLQPEDTINLFTYAILRLSPHALSPGVRSWSYLRKGSGATHPTVGTVSTNSSSISDNYGSQSTSGSDSNSTFRPLQSGKWVRGKDAFLTTDIWGLEDGAASSRTSTVWLRDTEEKMYLCAYQHKSLTLILFIPVSSISNGEQGIAAVKHQVLENASSKILRVEEKLSKGWGGENAYHVPGYRYLLVDGDRHVSRASPPGKVTTLTKDSLLALNKLREQVDLEKNRAKWDDANKETNLEVSIRAKNNAWVIARLVRGKELYMVLEKANETLLYASDAVEKFSNRYCNGAFSLD
ncbi:unnamed protein product [Rhodiola kirilowii]